MKIIAECQHYFGFFLPSELTERKRNKFVNNDNNVSLFWRLVMTMIWQSVLVVVICYLYIYLYFSYIYYLFLLLPWLWWIKIIKTRSWWSVYVVTGSELCTTMLLCNKTTANFYLSLQFMRSGASSKWSFERSGVIWCRTSLKRKSADNLLMTAMNVRRDRSTEFFCSSPVAICRHHTRQQ